MHISGIYLNHPDPVSLKNAHMLTKQQLEKREMYQLGGGYKRFRKIDREQKVDKVDFDGWKDVQKANVEHLKKVLYSYLVPEIVVSRKASTLHPTLWPLALDWLQQNMCWFSFNLSLFLLYKLKAATQFPLQTRMDEQRPFFRRVHVKAIGVERKHLCVMSGGCAILEKIIQVIAILLPVSC